MKSMTLIREEKIHKALSLLERTLAEQVKKLKNDSQHPFLEQCISQLGLLYKVTQKYEKAEECYTNLVAIKERFYGETSESLVISLKNLAGVQAL